jgi:hypothetical protein
MRRTIPMSWLLAALAAVGLAACDHDDGSTAAQATFSAFQDALQRRDESACRSLLTGESAQALADMPWDRVQQQQPLQVRGARRAGYSFRVDVVDPNANGSAGEFVDVRENGRLVVDLVASAGLTATVVEAAGSKQELAPRALTPEDFDRIRQHELAQPPR